MYATATLGSLSLLATIFEATTVPPASAQHIQTQRWSPMCARMRFSLRHVVVANSVCRTLNIYKNILSCILFTRKFDITWSPLPFVKRLHSRFNIPYPRENLCLSGILGTRKFKRATMIIMHSPKSYLPRHASNSLTWNRFSAKQEKKEEESCVSWMRIIIVVTNKAW